MYCYASNTYLNFFMLKYILNNNELKTTVFNVFRFKYEDFEINLS